MTKLTVKDLFEKKGKVKLTELYVTNALEAYAAEKAGIDIQIVSFKKETLRTGVPTNRWFSNFFKSKYKRNEIYKAIIFFSFCN